MKIYNFVIELYEWIRSWIGCGWVMWPACREHELFMISQVVGYIAAFLDHATVSNTSVF